MVSEFNRNQLLFRDIAVPRIRELFGPEFTTLNNEGNYNIDQDILKEFQGLTGDEVVWVRFQHYWRKRSKNDSPGRTQNPDRRPKL